MRPGYQNGISGGARDRKESGGEAARAMLISRAGSEEEHINLRLACPVRLAPANAYEESIAAA